jgi:catechol 2,3-dioxygenase-like lactoylglutathione lyase family enzyme
MSRPTRPKVQVVFDTRDPEKLARFYAEALGYRMQAPPKEFDTWEEALKSWGIPEEDWHSWAAIVDPDGTGPRIYFQQMDTPKPGKNRVHIDVNASEGHGVSLEKRKEQVAAKVARLKTLGASQQSEYDEGDYWIVMLDPEGNEFCVQ